MSVSLRILGAVRGCQERKEPLPYLAAPLGTQGPLPWRQTGWRGFWDLVSAAARAGTPSLGLGHLTERNPQTGHAKSSLVITWRHVVGSSDEIVGLSPSRARALTLTLTLTLTLALATDPKTAGGFPLGDNPAFAWAGPGCPQLLLICPAWNLPSPLLLVGPQALPLQVEVLPRERSCSACPGAPGNSWEQGSAVRSPASPGPLLAGASIASLWH
ncbi:hypothetical protein H8959_000994 [Pygathrix nigripes]